MTIYIDPPVWPSHGTTWSHLVSDSSYDELHAFARAIGLSRRAFDLDHYDVIADLHAAAIAAGAVPVASRDLVARLARAGLRIRPVDRPREYERRRRAELVHRWEALGEATSPADAREWSELGAALLARWAEPHRRYHDDTHLHDVLLALDQLADGGARISPAVSLAAWFHDAVYEGAPGDDERASAGLAASELARTGLTLALVDEVHRLVLATVPGEPVPGDDDAAMLLDADLAVLAAGTKRYREYATAVRAEYSHVADDQFRAGRAAIMQTYLDRDAIYSTPLARERWEARARSNLAAEIAELWR